MKDWHVKRGFLFLVFSLYLLTVATTAYSKAKPHHHARHAKVVLPGISTVVAWGYFHPSWEYTSAQFQGGVQEARPGDGIDRYLRYLASDPKHRIEKPFRLPSYLQDRVLFWLSIYARFPSQVRVVHDRENPGVVYGYIDFAPLQRDRLSPVMRERTARAIEIAVIAELKRILGQALGTTLPDTLPRDERNRILQLTASLSPTSVEAVNRLLLGVRTQTGQSDIFQMALARGRALMPEAEAVFREHQLPVSLARIPFVESSFNSHAHSKAGAIGIWQVTPVAARDVVRAGERRAIWHDSRVQSEAAARLLYRYRSNLPDWGTSVTAYNAGIGTMLRLVRKTHARNFKQVMESPLTDRALGFAGRNFFSEFLATTIIEAYKTQVFVPWLLDSTPEESPAARTITVQNNTPGMADDAAPTLASFLLPIDIGKVGRP